MSKSRVRRAAWIVGIVLGAGVFVAWLRRPAPVVIAMPPESEIEATLRDGGTTYKVFRGDAYVVGPAENQLTHFDHLFDPGFFDANYRVVAGVPNKLDRETGKLYPTRRHFEEGFEDATSVRDLIGEVRGWTGFTLQSPMAPRIPDYNELRRKIMQNQGDFLDNRIEATAERAHSGKQSLKCVCVPKSRGMVTAKASLHSSLIHLAKGDDLWFSAWYFVPDASGLPLTLVDFESTWIKEHPGLRLMLEDNGALMFELKWAGKPTYRQPAGQRVIFPTGRWVEIRIHATLSDGPDGLVELWQDGARLIRASGQTLPLASTIYDDLEVGISAHSAPGRTAVVFVDDVRLGDVE